MSVAPPSRDLQPLFSGLLKAYQHVQDAMKETQVWNQQRLEGSTKHSYRMLKRSVDTGDRTTAAVGILGLISDRQSIRQEEEGTVTTRLQPYLEALTHLIQEASQQMGVTCPLSNPVPGPGEGLGRANKRRYTDVLSPSVATTTLNAAEQRLLTTVIPESALLPDVAAMHDVYHPNVALYATDGDRDWIPRSHARMQLGFYTSTMLNEFVVHRDAMRRFSFVHLMHRMGFGAADVNFYVTYVDDTFFRRIYCDSRLSFLAESFSPRIRLYRGQNWAALWDLFLTNRYRTDNTMWTQMARAAFLCDAIGEEYATADPQQLIPSTVLGALHRNFGVRIRPYDAWSMVQTHDLQGLESEFLDGIKRLRHGTLEVELDAMRCHLRAWPVCLRSVAVEHVQLLVRSLSL